MYTIPLIFMSVAYYHIVRTLWRRNNLPNGGVFAGAATVDPASLGGMDANGGGSLINGSSSMSLLARWKK